MELANIVPWGRSFQDYKEMFSLSENDLKNLFWVVVTGQHHLTQSYRAKVAM